MAKTKKQTKPKSTKKTTKKTPPKRPTSPKTKSVTKSVTSTSSNTITSTPFLKKSVSMSAILSILIPLLALAVVGGFMAYRWLVVATVNGTPISRLAYYQMLEQQAGEETMDVLIIETLIMQEAKKQGISIDQSEIEDEIKSYEDSIVANGSTLDEALSYQGMTRETLEKQIRLTKLAQQMAAQNAEEVTDEEVTEYLTENAAQYEDLETEEEQFNAAKEDLESQGEYQSFQEWLANLRSTADIKYFGSNQPSLPTPAVPSQ